jgi:hypothetical protein
MSMSEWCIPSALDPEYVEVINEWLRESVALGSVAPLLQTWAHRELGLQKISSKWNLYWFIQVQIYEERCVME